MNYLYYFLDYNNTIIYIGKTGNIKRRMKEHFLQGHLPKECYDNVYQIMYACVNDSKYDTSTTKRDNTSYSTIIKAKGTVTIRVEIKDSNGKELATKTKSSINLNETTSVTFE